MPLSPDQRDEIADCLRRSGYLLESRLVSALAKARFFVEPNAAVLDRRTGKSREIDLLAEYFDYDPDRPKISVLTRFAIEAINNSLPLVLLSPDPRSPNVDVADPRFATTPDSNPFEVDIEVWQEKETNNGVKFSQYCALTRKKSGDALMASHPDDLYSSLLKLAELVEEQASEFENREWSEEDDFWRLWFWQGILVVGGDLVVAIEDTPGALSIAEVDRGSLIFNFHFRDQPRSLVIEFIREHALLPYLQEVVAADRRVRQRIHQIRWDLGADAT